MNNDMTSERASGSPSRSGEMQSPQINEDFTARSKLQDVGRWVVTRHIQELARQLPAGASVLDAGAGECVYKKYFAHCKYVSIDLAVGEDAWNYQNLDYVAPLDDMPFQDNTFDYILCTQVFEHLEWPRECVKEMYRVLKPGGKLYFTAPMAHNEHQTPYDFFRYTSYGLRSLCAHAGFSKVEVRPFGGMFMRWAYEMPRGLSIFPAVGLRSKRPNLKAVALLPLKLCSLVTVRCVQTLFLYLDRFDRKREDPFGWNGVADK